jgi:hypothetical protein
MVSKRVSAGNPIEPAANALATLVSLRGKWNTGPILGAYIPGGILLADGAAS